MKNTLKTFLIDVWMSCMGGRGSFKVLRKKTAVVFEAEIPIDTCASLVERIDTIASMDEHDRVWRDTTGSDTRILAFETVMEDCIHYLRIEDRIDAIEKYLGTSVNSWFLMANRVLPASGNLGSGGGLHRDSPFSHQVKCIWYLTDVGSDNGPFQYVPGTHFSAYADRGKYPLGETRFENAKDPLIDALAPAGSLLVADTKCIHGGKPIESGSRYALTLYTFKTANKSREVFRHLGINPAYVQPANKN